jgi:hypothetical protein
MAAPHVAGVAALYLETDPAAAPDTVAAALAGMSTPGVVTNAGSGSPNNLLFMGRISGQPLLATPGKVTACVGTNASYTVTAQDEASFPMTLSAQGAPAGTQTTFGINPFNQATSTTLTISNTNETTPGSYPITIFGAMPASTSAATVTLELLDTPAVVTPVAPVVNAADISMIPTFSWNSSASATGYRLEIATEPTFTTPLYAINTNSTRHTITGRLDPNTTYYWRVRASNGCGDGTFSAASSFATRAAPPVLLVDDDDNDPDVLTAYTAALDATATNYDVFDTINNSDQDPTADLMDAYGLVIWFTGGNFADQTGPNAYGEAELIDYLSNSTDRCLLMSSQDYLWVRGINLEEPNSFMVSYLGVNSAVSDVGDSVAAGTNDFAGLGPYTLDFPYFNYTDQLSPSSTAMTAFVSDDGQPIGVSKITTNYRSSWWAFPFEAIPGADNRRIVMERALGWCFNSPPSDISLDANRVIENRPAGQLVGAFESVDLNTLDTHTYSLIAGSGDTDNASFTISGNRLETAVSFDFEAKSNYSIRVQSNDGNGGSYAETFTITVDNENEAPVALPDTVVILSGATATINADANDIDPEADPIVVDGVDQPVNGTAALNAQGNIIYTPDANFIGVDVFAYTVTDGYLSSTGTVSVTVAEGTALVTVTPDQDASLVVGGAAANISATLQIPAGAVSETIKLVYLELVSPNHPMPDTLQAMGHNVSIYAATGGQVQAGYDFIQPIALTLTYIPDWLADASTDQLSLHYWNEATQTWQTDGLRLVDHDKINHRITFELDHLTEFALTVQSASNNQVFLPILLK